MTTMITLSYLKGTFFFFFPTIQNLNYSYYICDLSFETPLLALPLVCRFSTLGQRDLKNIVASNHFKMLILAW